MSDQVQHNCPRDLYIYVDETGNDGVSSQIGYGFFVTYQRYDELCNIIYQAKSKCNMTKDDFFHASNDRDTKRECLLSAINNSLSGEFFAIFELKAKEFDNSKSSTNGLLKKLLRVLLVKFAFLPVVVNIVMESKQGINRNTIVNMIKNFVEYSRFGDVRFISYYYFLIKQSNSKPTIAQYFNLINCEDANKDNAGCQIVDFLLWAYARNKSGNDASKFYDRLNKSITSISSAILAEVNSNDISLVSCIINQFDKSILNYPEGILGANLKILNSELADLYIFIENTLEEFILLQSISSNVIHHHNDIKATKILIKNARIYQNKDISNLIKMVCKVFVYLFDTLPLYTQQDDLLWWLKAKALASSLYFKDKKELLVFYNDVCIYWIANNRYRSTLYKYEKDLITRSLH